MTMKPIEMSGLVPTSGPALSALPCSKVERERDPVPSNVRAMAAGVPHNLTHEEVRLACGLYAYLRWGFGVAPGAELLLSMQDASRDARASYDRRESFTLRVRDDERQRDATIRVSFEARR